MASPKFKRLKTLDDDHSRPITAAIPYLPDNVIEQILSFLPIKLAAQANAVSKQWAAVWPPFSAIEFDEGDSSPAGVADPAKFQRFLRFLENCLKRCERQRVLDKLSLRIIYCVAGDDEYVINRCVDFAIRRCVKEMDIRFVEFETEVSLYLIPQPVFSSKFLVILNLEKVRVNFSSVNLTSLKTMSLKDVEFEFDDKDDESYVPSLVSGCPCIQCLSIDQCNFGYSADLEISSSTLRSLEIRNCHLDLAVKTINLESFELVTECTCIYHDSLTLWDCDNLRKMYIHSEGLKQLHLLGCQNSMENSIFTPNLNYFLFSGIVEAKINFLEAPSVLLDSIIRITNYFWTSEYYSLLRDCLASFDCSRKVEIDICDAEGVMIPEDCRIKLSPPLPSIKQLQLTFTIPLRDRDYWLSSSLTWLAPSADILPYKYDHI